MTKIEAIRLILELSSASHGITITVKAKENSPLSISQQIDVRSMGKNCHGLKKKENAAQNQGQSQIHSRRFLLDIELIDLKDLGSQAQMVRIS